jgi:hypothetical protein
MGGAAISANRTAPSLRTVRIARELCLRLDLGWLWRLPLSAKAGRNTETGQPRAAGRNVDENV